MSDKVTASYEGKLSGTNPGGMPFGPIRVSGTICVNDPTSEEEILEQLNAVFKICRRRESSVEPEIFVFEGTVGRTHYTLQWDVATLVNTEPACPEDGESD